MNDGPINVLADAQFTFATALRPYDGFEEQYQGQSSLAPVAFPGGLDTDAEAGTAGYSPQLVKGQPVPMGAKVLLWIPVALKGALIETITSYTYQIAWRIRNIADFRRRRTPYHISKQATGAVDTSVSPSQPRLIIPACLEDVMFEQTEPADAFSGSTATGNLRANGVVLPPDGALNLVPLLPDGSFGDLEQGIADPAIVASAGGALFRPYMTVAKGDEMIILAWRPQSASFSTWDFKSDLADAAFSNIYGTNVKGPTHPPYPELGIYVMTGSNPS